MSKITFSANEIIKLQKNPNVDRVSSKSITYTSEFRNRFIDEYLLGKFPRQIFEENGFNIEVMGMKRIEQCAFRWKKAYETNGITGLSDNRKLNSGRPLLRELSKEEIIMRQEVKIKLLEEQLEHIKKFEGVERRLLSQRDNLTSNQKYQLIYEVITKNNLSQMIKYLCDFMRVSRSGYYHYLSTTSLRDEREIRDLESKELILKAFNRHGIKKGSRQIKMTLENEFGIIFSRKKIQRIMRKYGIECPYRKPNPYKKMAKATKEHRVVPNKLNRNFKQGIPGLVLLTDITYLFYGNGRVGYLSTIKDGSTNEILAYHISDRITLDIATETIKKLMRNKKVTLHKDAFIHSDQGVHYTSPKYQKLLKDCNLGQSMSRRGNCWDNAPQESFFGHMKDEVDYKSSTSLEDLKNKINHYITYYNNYRCQWDLKKMTPIQFRNHLLAA